MYFDFDDRYLDTEMVGSAISRREGVMLSVVLHALLVLALVLLPRLLPDSRQRLETRRVQPEPPQDAPQFVFVQPRVELDTPVTPPRAEASDRDRLARAPEIVERPANPLPYARGNSRDRVEAAPEERAMGRGPAPEPAPPAPDTAPGAEAMRLPENGAMPMPRPGETREAPPPRPQGGALGDALRNLQRYMQQESFDNRQGGSTEFGPLQFDTKGVEFGPWVRRFIAQVRRNWFVPYAAMTLRGHVVLQFVVHRDGRISDITIAKPSPVESFNTAAFNALVASSPTTPLPPEYPDDRAFFTVTFYYNETPGGAP